MPLQLTPPLLALPIVEFATYFLIITQLHKYFMRKKLKMLESPQIKNFVSSTSLSERTMLEFHDELLAKTLIITCVFGIILLVAFCCCKKMLNIETIDTTYNNSLQTHLLCTFAITILTLYFLPPKVGFYLYTFGITFNLLLINIDNQYGSIVFFSRSILALESTAYFLGYRGLILNTFLNLLCYIIVFCFQIHGLQEISLRERFLNDINLEYIFAILWFCNYSFRVEHRNEVLVNLLLNSTNAKTDFLAKMSHQLRTPLFGIVGNLDILQSEGLTHSQYSTVKIIQSCCENLLTTISDILDLSKIEYGRISLRNALTNLYSLVNDSIDIIYPQLILKNLEIIKVLDKPLPRFFLGDESRIKQVLVNLLSNSIKFSHPGGKITLIISTDDEIFKKYKENPNHYTSPTSEEERGKQTVSGEVINSSSSRKRRSSISLFRQTEKNDVLGNLYFLVSDSGIGITELQKENIFLPFFRCTQNSKNVDSIGLGLTIAKYFVEEMDGNISFYSKGYNRGATFCFSIPYKVPNMKVNKRATIRNRDNNNNNKQKYVPPKLSRAATKEEISHIKFPHLAPSNIPDRKQLLLKSYSDDRFKTIIGTKQAKLIGSETKDDASSAAATKKRILVAEDNEINRSIIIRMIKPFGYHIDVAENGRIAYHMCKNALSKGEEYNIILMDLEMPLMGGIETTKKLREELDIKAPIIALSAHALHEVRDKAFNVGFNDFISKPFNQKMLTESIKKVNQAVNI